MRLCMLNLKNILTDMYAGLLMYYGKLTVILFYFNQFTNKHVKCVKQKCIYYLDFMLMKPQVNPILIKYLLKYIVFQMFSLFC